MKQILKRSIVFIVVLSLSVMVVSCNITDTESGAESSSLDGKQSYQNSEGTESTTSETTSSESTTSETTSSDDEVLLENDVLLMKITIDGTEKYICLNEDLDDPYEFRDNEPERKTFDFAILTDYANSNEPTLIRAGDTFMGFEVKEVTANFFCYDDGTMYPDPNITIKMEGSLSGKAVLEYHFYDSESKEEMLMYPVSEFFDAFPYPIYTSWSYSPDLYEMYKNKFLKISNIEEVVDKYDLEYGDYNVDITISEFYIYFYQPGITHYCAVTADSITFE